MSGRRLRVVEVGSGVAASYAAHYLQSLGAHVTKLARNSSDPASLAELDRGKATHLIGDADFELRLRELTRDCDVVVFAGKARDVNAGPASLEELRRLNSKLITAAITPFGERGRHRDFEGADLIAVHSGGLGYGTPPRVEDPDKEHPLGIPGDLTEPLTGLVLTLGVLNAVLERDRDGKGRHVEVSAQDAVVSLMFNNIAGFLETGQSPGRLASDRPGARRQFLTCADGLLVQMAGRPHHLRAWLRLIGLGAEEPSTALDGSTRQERRSEALNSAADRWAAGRTRRQITDLAQAEHIPIEPVLDLAEVLVCPQLAARDFWDTGGKGERLAGHPFGPIAGGQTGRFMPGIVAPPEANRAWRELKPRPGPLSGIRVLDFTWVFAGPIASRILATLGATVVKVEARGNNEDGGRRFLARTLQGGKFSIVRDLNTPEDRGFVQQLAAESDVVIENFSTGVMERHDLGWSRLSAVNPKLVMVSISGMGRTGPYSHHVMFGQIAQGYSGLTSIIGYEGGPPRGIEDGGFWSDPVTGYAAAAATLAALRERQATGVGRRIDISLVEATVATLFRPLLAASHGEVWKPRGNFHPEMAPHDVYRTGPQERDSWVAIACRSDREWQDLATLVGGRSLAEDPRFITLRDRQSSRNALRAEIENWSRSLSAREAAEACQALGIPAAPCQTTEDVVNDPHLGERGFFVDSEGSPFCLAFPWTVTPATLPLYLEAAVRGSADVALR
jgi:crotonobetainyl-CoA:carnitine CoA-transferase CaiB-like acyl-CoA transferase